MTASFFSLSRSLRLKVQVRGEKTNAHVAVVTKMLRAQVRMMIKQRHTEYLLTKVTACSCLMHFTVQLLYVFVQIICLLANFDAGQQTNMTTGSFSFTYKKIVGLYESLC